MIRRRAVRSVLSVFLLAGLLNAGLSSAAVPSVARSFPVDPSGEAWNEAVEARFPSSDSVDVQPPAFDDGRSTFVARVGDEIIPYRQMAVFVRPDAWVQVEVLRGQLGDTYRIDATSGMVAPLTSRSWAWHAPDAPGLYPLRITGAQTGAVMTVQAFVLEPFLQQTTSLNGYRIGHYRTAALSDSEAYLPPEGFVRVTESLQNVPVSPHFTLGQFLCKQTDTFPQYALVRTRLLIKLEMILQILHEKGMDVPTLTVQSAFRTPYHNHAIGAGTTYSRHVYGDAADIYVDADGDGRMDDLNKDGRLSRADARVLADLVREVEDRLDIGAFIGGIGVYGSPHHRNAFVHVDTRGFRAAWSE